MAIVEMKRIGLLALRRDRRRLMRAMQTMGCVEISPIGDEALAEWAERDSAALTGTEATLSRLSWTIGQLGTWNKQKAPFMGNLPDADPAEVAWVETHEAEMLSVLDRAEELERLAGEYKGQLARLRTQYDQLAVWRDLDIPVEEIRDDRAVIQLVGTVESGALESLKARIEGSPAVLTEVSAARENACVWIAAHRSVREDLSLWLKEAGFTPARFGGSTGTVRQQLDVLSARMAEAEGRQAGLREEWQTLSENLTRCKIWYDLLQTQRDRQQAEQRTIGTGEAFLMQGWVPAAAAAEVEKRLKALSPSCSVDISDPAEGEEPPIALRNSRAVTPFESIVEGFALPAYGSMDPTPPMAPFYALLFGMMLSDAGYGLVMAIAIPLLVKIKKPGKSNQKILWVLFFSAIATVVCGFVYDTWFGFNPMKDLLHMKPLLDPINDPIPVMVVCMGIGVIHLFAGLACGIYMNCKRGKPIDGLYDQVSWMLLITGLILLVLGGTAAEIGKWMAIAGTALIVLFAGREKKNPVSRLIGGLGALYGATSWISDILSYMRLFGMGLATGVIGMVVNLLVGMVFENGIIGIVIGSVLFVGAHAFNLGINALGAYVHACRLQYIEFFGKFYEEGGKPFQPLRSQTRYVRFREAG